MSAPGEQEFDEHRELCGDGNCLGVVVDGKCNVCGLVAAAGTSPRDPASGQTGGIVDNGAGDMVAEGGHTDDAFDDEERQLCPDGACTGLIGSDGKCKECGRPAAT